MRIHRTRSSVLAALLLTIGLGVRQSDAQTIRPIVSEYRMEAHGRFEVVNDTDRPLNVVIDPRGFVLSESGEVQDAPFPARVTVRLSSSSMRLPPRQSRIVFYDATTDQAPAWFVLYANFTGFPAREFSGINVQLELPHFVYLLPKQSWTRDQLHVATVEHHADTATLSIVVANEGPSFGRIASVEVEGRRRRITLPGFPLFPGGRRYLRVPWDQDEAPELVEITTKDFSFVERLPPPRR